MNWTTKQKSSGIIQHTTIVKGKWGVADVVITEDEGSFRWSVHGDMAWGGEAKSLEQAKRDALKKAHDDVDSQYKERPIVGRMSRLSSMRDISKQILEAGMGAVDKLPGGTADGAPASEFDNEQLNKGIQHEMEHTKDAAIAEEIAKDHLKEDPQYYTKLDEAKLAGVDTATLSACHPLALARLSLTPEPEGQRLLQKGDVCLGPDGKQYRVHDVVDGAVSATAFPNGSDMVYFKEDECKEVDPSRFALGDAR